MPFQFLCPQGHLLEGHESQMGQHCQCPICGTMCIVPHIGPPAAVPVQPVMQPPVPHYAGAAVPPPVIAPPPPPPGPAAPAPPTVRVTEDEHEPAEDEPSGDEDTDGESPEDDEDRIIRIPCPNGHELHTPMSMVDTEAMCPECGEQFVLRYEDSIEGREELALKRALRDERNQQRVLKWSIGAAIAVGLGLLTIVIVSLFKSDPEAPSPEPPPPVESAEPVQPNEGSPPPAPEEASGSEDKPKAGDE